ncbi:MAG: ROK family protein [Anaerolineae bacterium]|nr:ROK family protein [Anaerolineae bacterium]
MKPLAISILYQIHQSQPVTRRMLGEQTGLSASRVNTLVSYLIDRRLIREEVRQDGTRGRPAVSLSINPNAGRVLGLDIGGQYSRAVLSDLAGGVIASLIYPTQAVPDREVILSNIIRVVEAICQEGGVSPKEIAALGVGVRGIVDSRTGIVLDWPNTPSWAAAWAGLDLSTVLRTRLGVDLIVVDDSVRAMGLAAQRFGSARGSKNFLYVFLGTGIGSGVFVDGKPYRGGSGLAGELGHVTIADDGPWCSCGSRGCLETLASTRAVLRRVQERLAEPQLISSLRASYERKELTLDALIEAARAGDKLAFQILDETGTYIGKVLAIALNLLGPELVVLGGPLAQDGGIILEAVQRQVRLHALQHISSQTRIIYDDQGELVGAHGAALLALDALFTSPEHLGKLANMTVPSHRKR